MSGAVDVSYGCQPWRAPRQEPYGLGRRPVCRPPRPSGARQPKHLAAQGHDRVINFPYPLSRRWRLLDLLDLLVPEDTILVAVRCPLPELERREIERGDRQLGLAAMQYDAVHAHGLHDIDVDTSAHSPRECALQIRDFL